VRRTPDKGIILSRIPQKHGKPSRLTIAVAGSTVAVAAVASAMVAIWPVGAAAQQPAAAPQNRESQQAAGSIATSATEADRAATDAVVAADAKVGQAGGQPMLFWPQFMAYQHRLVARQARRAAAARRARRAAAAAARRAAAAAARRAERQQAQAAAPASAQPSGSPQQIAAAMLGSYGWSSSEFGCLDELWSRESGWNPTAANPSGAYGIPQALPGSKMASAGADWQTNPATQIRWGLGYIKDLYGSPCGAWNHELATGSY
jgi:hypothetical protein